MVILIGITIIINEKYKDSDGKVLSLHICAIMSVCHCLCICKLRQQTRNVSSKEAIELIQAASQQRDYNRILTLADSLEKSGDLSLGDSYFWQGYAYYRMPQVLTAEFYWKEAILATENHTDEASLMTYAKSASYLTNLLCRDVDFSSALKVATPVVSRLEQLKADTTSHYEPCDLCRLLQELFQYRRQYC